MKWIQLGMCGRLFGLARRARPSAQSPELGRPVALPAARATRRAVGGPNWQPAPDCPAPRPSRRRT